MGEGRSASPDQQRLAVVVPGTAEFDSRTHRIARSVAARGHDVIVHARSGPGTPPGTTIVDGYRVIRSRAASGVPRLLPVRIVDRAWSAARHGRAAEGLDPGADVYHGMAFLGLPVALRLGERAHAPTVYDARDLYVDARNLARLPRPVRAIVRARERSWARRASAVVTVNAAIADILAERFGVRRPTVVMNCAPRWNPPGAWPRLFHARLGVPAGHQIVLYHGGLEPDRGVEQLLAAVPLLSRRAHVVLMGYGVLRDAFESRIAADAALRDRVHVLPPAPPEALLDWVASADVEVAAIQPTTLNNRVSTPNKLFESLAAGVPIVSSDFPIRRRILIDDPLGAIGAVCDPRDPISIAAAVASILDPPDDARHVVRRRCLRAAHERYAWETQLEALLALYGRLTDRPW